MSGDAVGAAVGAERATVAVAFERRGQRARAEALAQRLGLPVAKGFRDPHDLHLLLTRDDRLGLRVNAHAHPESPLAGGRAVSADLLGIDVDSGAGRSLRGPLLRAVGIKRGDGYRPRVLDATAGFGGDAWLLAAAGCVVDAVERDPVMHALLEDALERARATGAEPARRLRLHHADAASWLTGALEGGGGARPEVVVLDPMFPPGRKTLEKKPLRLARWLVGNAEPDGSVLFRAAAGAASRRVVVKRPRRAPGLVQHPPPAHAYQGRGFRFDIYPV